MNRRVKLLTGNEDGIAFICQNETLVMFHARLNGLAGHRR